MNNAPIQRYKQFLVLFAIMIVTLACSIPDVRRLVEEAAREECYPVDRAMYEREAIKLGLTPKEPKDPERAIYELCSIEDQASNTERITSARMTEGYRPEKDEDIRSTPAESEKVEDVSSTPAGTYIGVEMEVPTSWKLVQSKFIIDVAEDGTVTGSRIFLIKKETITKTCTWRYENGHNTNINGKITGAAGNARVENDSYAVSDATECGGKNNRQTLKATCEKAQITISGDRMEIIGDGSKNCGFHFKATKKK